MPFQSIRSLKAARKLKNDETTKSTPQNHADCQSASTSAARLVAGRELENGVARAHHPLLLAGDLLEVRGIVPQPVDRLGEPRGLLAEGRVVALERLQLPTHVLQADDAAPAVDAEPEEQDHGHGAADEAGAHRATRV